MKSNILEYKLIEIYGFVIGILSMYGIYIGFLQFIIGDSEKQRYLGVNKLKYLTNTSIWYQITQTKSFLVTLFLLIILPLLIVNTHNELQSSLLHIWEAGLILVLCIYIFLINMSLEILRILFLIKDEIDSGLESNIKNSIANNYYERFDKMYKTGFQHDDIKWFFKMIEYDLQKVSKIEKDEFFITIFSKIEKNILYSYGNFKKVRKVKLYYGTSEQYLYNDYKKFIDEKWKFLTSLQKNISFSSFNQMIQTDNRIFELFIEENSEVIKEKKLLFWRDNEIENVHKYLFDKLLVKAFVDNEIGELCEDVKETTIRIKEFDSKNEELINYYKRVEKHKWEKIFDKYLETGSSFGLPKFREKEIRKIQLDEEEKFETIIYDYDNYEFYSHILFNYLTRTFNYLTEEQIENERLKNLIKKMNNGDRVAYALYQLLYPDEDIFGENTLFFECQLREALSYSPNEGEELYLESAQKVSNLQDVSHRLTLTVLNEIFYSRNKIIKNITYFEQFFFSRISTLKWLFVQNILSSQNKYRYRILISNKQNIEELRSVEGLCINYLRVVDRYPSLCKDFGLRTTIKKLLEENPLDSVMISRDIGIIGLIWYELLVGTSVSKQTFMKTIEDRFEEKERYFFLSLGVFEFFVWKLIDLSYEEVFKNDGILDAIKLKGNSILRNNNMAIDEYVESIYIKLINSNIVVVGKIDIELVANKLARVLS